MTESRKAYREVQQATMSDHQPSATVPDRDESSLHSRATYLPYPAMFTFALLFPIAATISAVAIVFFKWRWRRIPYDPNVPPKSRYFWTLKPPQHELDPEDKCAHCQDDFIDPLELPCGHMFCTDCIKGLIEHEQTRCPLCNRPQFTMIEPWAVLFVRLGSASTVVAILAQLLAMIVAVFQPDGLIKVNPWPSLSLINIFLMSSVGLLIGAVDYDMGDKWIANLALPVTMTFAWLAYTVYFAGHSTILLQLSFWAWSLFGVGKTPGLEW